MTSNPNGASFSEVQDMLTEPTPKKLKIRKAVAAPPPTTPPTETPPVALPQEIGGEATPDYGEAVPLDELLGMDAAGAPPPTDEELAKRKFKKKGANPREVAGTW
jgi:hypothetical protein